MSSRTFVPWLALGAAAIVLAGCGQSSGSTAGAAAPTGVPTVNGAPVVIDKSVLSGTTEPTGGAQGGVGDAIVALHLGSMICYRFAHLHGFQTATGATLGLGPTGKPGKMVLVLSPGPRLHHQGCVHAPAAVWNGLKAAPGHYFVNITSAHNPSGAVRAQL
ncbi:CHRD domain-containing protein [Conexibacter sp. DBS9H8]|uniref:CHRD domain-containing protein n=1 Tax=Conexibacter sp. DBS9H8 TaxID=2937801 RepID=UPI00200C085B|nr:CHRD domain-containing protein [Conexibacter sp. DBS9H8]